MDAFQAQGDQAYLLRLCRELEDAILHMRLNEREIGLWVFRSEGDAELLAAHESLLAYNPDQVSLKMMIEHWPPYV